MRLTTGPEKIEISDEQLEQMKNTYKELNDDVLRMLDDFFTPMELMKNEGVFSGKSAEAYTEFCMLTNQYLKIRFEMSLQELQNAGERFKEQIDQVESLSI